MVLLKLSNPVTDEQIEKRKELERKLAENKEDLVELENSLKDTADATGRILNTLSQFDSRLSRLEAYILPIHRSTQTLTRKNNNLATALGLITEYTNVVGAINWHETVISKAVTNSTLDTFLDSIAKLKEALQLLEDSKYKSSERITQDLRGKLFKGIQELDFLFESNLLELEGGVKPEMSHSNAGEEEAEEEPLSREDLIKNLQKLSHALSDSLEKIGPVTGFTTIYAKIRGAYLVKCLLGDCAAAKDQEVKMGYTREQYQRGSSLLIPFATNMLKFLQEEYEMLSEVIPKHHLNSIFVSTVGPSVDNFLECAEALLNRVRRSIQRREINDLYVMIDVWDGLYKIKTKEEVLLVHCGRKGHDFISFLSTSAAVILGFLKDFLDEFKAESDSKKQAVLSPDGTVHEVTSTV